MLKPNQDAYGQELMAAWQGKEVFEIIERDDGYIPPDPTQVSQYFSDCQNWSDVEKRGIQLARGRVLDVGCGAGRVALYLQEQGLEVVGIDNSPLALEVCRLRGVRQLSPTSITEVGPHLGTFDTIVMFGNNFGLCGSFVRARWLLRKFHALTSLDGRIIATTLDPYQTDNPLHLEYHANNRQRGRMSGQIRIRVRYEKTRSPWFDYLFVSRDEMLAILQGTGWQVKEWIDSPDSPIYVTVIEKG